MDELTCILKNISGCKKNILIGSDVNEIDLNLLLSPNVRKCIINIYMT